ncbi:MAG TPA: hypothetical protein VEZ11_19195 [Thermoanaerobaculia bacterium]|nr:hypothetical protein [Thermoanaerobaculia bacterium]
MNEACPFETNAIRAARENRWSEALREHVRGCADCAEAAELAPWMHRFASMEDREHILPDPSIVWLKAQLLEGRIAAERISRPMTQIQMAAYVVVAGCWAALLTWKWNTLEQWLATIMPSHFVLGGASYAAGPSLSASFFITILVLASLTMALALHTILAED